jgi:hypothetical protein
LPLQRIRKPLKGSPEIRGPHQIVETAGLVDVRTDDLPERGPE